MAVNWNTIGSQSAFSWQSMGISLVVQCHLIVSQLAHLRQIGRLQIWPTPRIWPKPRLLIGLDLEMLASHWSRGPSESFQRGYPYDPEPAPIERFWPQMTLGSSNCISIGSEWISISIGRDINCYRIGSQLASDGIQICIILDHNWHLFWSHLALDWTSIGLQLDLNWHPIGYQVVSD